MLSGLRGPFLSWSYEDKIISVAFTGGPLPPAILSSRDIFMMARSTENTNVRHSSLRGYLTR